jgi:hypothetical protein
MDADRFERMRRDLGQGYMPSRVSMLVNLWRKALRKGYTLEDLETFVEYGRAHIARTHRQYRIVRQRPSLNKRGFYSL